jgi:hypothetical protein
VRVVPAPGVVVLVVAGAAGGAVTEDACAGEETGAGAAGAGVGAGALVGAGSGAGTGDATARGTIAGATSVIASA